MRSGRVATVVHGFDVPELAPFRVSTPVLSDAQEGGAGPEAQVVKLARRQFEQGQRLFCQFEVYGAERDASGQPRVAMGYVVKPAEGAILARVDPSEIQPTSLGKLSRVVLLGLEKAPPGDYTLVMAILDMVSGKMLELSEPFSVLPPAAAQAGAGS
jgi:hypothetical protein